MLDVNVIRSNPDMIRTMLKNRNKDDAILDRFLAADSEWRALTDENNRLRKVRNDVSLQISKMPKGEEKDARIKEMREVSDKIKANDDRMAELEEVRQDCVLNIPNIPHESVPIGKDEHDNVVVYEKGEKRKFDFKPKEHWEIAEDLDIIDFDRAVKVAGSGFYCLKGDGARLERALINYFLDTHMDQGYTELFPPVVVNKAAVIGTGQYPNLKDDMYYLERDGCPSPTSSRTRSWTRTSSPSTGPRTSHPSGGRSESTRTPGESSGSTSSTRLRWSTSSSPRTPTQGWRS